jgi:hypothetical protein
VDIQEAFNQFFAKYNNQPNVGDTPENKGQCVGLIEVWTDFLGLPHTWGNADDLYNNADPAHFDKIKNTPTAIPQVGDIPVWEHEFNNGVGHTGVATGKNTNMGFFEAFEANDPLKSPCHIKVYNYAYVQGWLRPKLPPVVQSPGMPPYLSELLTENHIDPNNETMVRAFIQLAIMYPGVKTDLDSNKAQVATLTDSLRQDEDKLNNLASANNQQANMINDLNKQLKECQAATPPPPPPPSPQPPKPTLSWWDRLLAWIHS